MPVAVDAMGGDLAPDAIVEGAVLAAKAGIPVVLVGQEAVVRGLLPRGFDLPVVDAREVVTMEDAAAASIRRKPDASILRTLELVKAGKACAAVSCGHSGAFLVAAVWALGVVEGVERPAIATVLPRSDGGRVVLLDAGANVDCRPEQLAEFALLGAAYAEVLGVTDPRVGLLSNGGEAGKGNALVRAAAPLIEQLPLRFVGHVEPTAALASGCDVLVCDGFVGNVVLKSIEAAVDTVVSLFGAEIRSSMPARAGQALLTGAFRRFRERVAWDAHGGALLVGARGTVVVGHGRANPEAVARAVKLAHLAARGGLVPALERRLRRQGPAA